MTFVLMLVLAAAAAVAVGVVVYWLTVLALRTLDRLAPYWYVRYIGAGQCPPPPERPQQVTLYLTRLEDGAEYPYVLIEQPYDWRSDEPDGS